MEFKSFKILDYLTCESSTLKDAALNLAELEKCSTAVLSIGLQRPQTAPELCPEIVSVDRRSSGFTLGYNIVKNLCFPEPNSFCDGSLSRLAQSFTIDKGQPCVRIVKPTLLPWKKEAMQQMLYGVQETFETYKGKFAAFTEASELFYEALLTAIISKNGEFFQAKAIFLPDSFKLYSPLQNALAAYDKTGVRPEIYCGHLHASARNIDLFLRPDGEFFRDRKYLTGLPKIYAMRVAQAADYAKCNMPLVTAIAQIMDARSVFSGR